MYCVARQWKFAISVIGIGGRCAKFLQQMYDDVVTAWCVNVVYFLLLNFSWCHGVCVSISSYSKHYWHHARIVEQISSRLTPFTSNRHADAASVQSAPQRRYLELSTSSERDSYRTFDALLLPYFFKQKNHHQKINYVRVTSGRSCVRRVRLAQLLLCHLNLLSRVLIIPI